MIGLIPEMTCRVTTTSPLDPSSGAPSGAIQVRQVSEATIVDAVNPVEAARAAWRGLAGRRGAALAFVE